MLAVAERIDNLAVAFALGERPSGTRDPYGLRRAAIGLCRLALASSFPIDVKGLVGAHTSPARRAGRRGIRRAPGRRSRLRGRAARRPPGRAGRVRARRARLRHHPARPAGRARRRPREAARSRELDAVHTVYTRTSRLAGKEAAQAAATSTPACCSRPPSGRSSQRSTGWRRRSRPPSGRTTSTRRSPRQPSSTPPLQRFFEDVLVMADDAAVRANRLRLLLDVRDTVGTLGDFAQIPRT